jgi:hypothetical protein
MSTSPAGILHTKNLLVLYLSLLMLQGFSQPATLTGIVTNCVTNSPVVGALVTADIASTYSVSGGIYTLSINTPGTYTVSCSFAGFVNYQSNPISFGQGSAVNLPICLTEITNPPAQVVALLDTAIYPPSVNISWQAPRGDYELLYDDGIKDDFTVWAIEGNMNALKFTPLGYPVTVTGGMVNIGVAADYPAGSTPFVPFQMAVYDASGPGGMPGVVIAGPVDVLPANYGWINFSIPSAPVITSGNFYLVMIQGGDAPNATHLAVDETNPQLRSYSDFITSGSFPWYPGEGNFMIRAMVNGPGGPSASYSPGSITGFTVSRLMQGEEQNPLIWTLLGLVTSSQITDNSWSSLPCGPYRWEAQAIYTGNRNSGYSFSNVIGKCWTINSTVKVALSCDSSSMKGITIRLKNLAYPDTLYLKQADTTGTASFPRMWKGSYELTASRFGYLDFVQNYSISTDTTLHVTLLQDKAAPSGLVVNDSSLIAHWNKPTGLVELFKETWASGSFLTNNWSVAGLNWRVSTAIGEPAPSVMFNWWPHAMNYDQSITSKPIVGQNSSSLRLNYDIYLNNFGTTTLNQMAVEIWDGSDWHTLRNYDNSHGDIQWTTQQLDISAYSDLTFKLRFRAYGEESDDINNWNIDNISVIAQESQSLAGKCVLGYDFYINNFLCGVSQDTVYQLPPSLAPYGSSCNACVAAVYGSGLSSMDCFSFTSGYLPPPTNLQGTIIVSTASLTWNKPVAMMKSSNPGSDPPGLKGYRIVRNGMTIDSVSNPDTLHYSDPGLYPGTYNYKVASIYDLTSYGNPGHFADSYPAGPVAVNIIYGYKLPFTEDWDQGTFSYQDWTLSPDTGNWSISNIYGNPSPSAEFSWNPLRTNYSYALVSPVLDATEVACSNIWLNFDCRLIDHNSTGNEKMDVEVFYNNSWHGIAEFTNTGTTYWVPVHLDLSPVKGNAFSLRFRASGKNSNDIVSWDIDNINIYAVCKPPENLSASLSGENVVLNWSSPVCPDGYPLHEGFEEPTFPPVNWTQIITDQNHDTWMQTSSSAPAGVHSGSYAAGVPYDYSHQDEWLIAHNVQITGNLTFWSYAFQGSVHLDHYYVKLSEDQGAHWETLMDMSALAPYPSPTGYNEWAVPYIINLSSHVGQVADIAWQAVDGDGQGLWYIWIIDDCSVGSKKLLLQPKSAPIEAYSVFRREQGGAFNMINTAPVSDTSYIDQGPGINIYQYYVTAYNVNCLSGTSSDTVLVNLVTGISSHDNQLLNVFPNPAHEVVNIKSGGNITGVEIFDCYGQKIFTRSNLSVSELKIDVNDFQQGIYFFKVRTTNSQQTLKVSVIH